MGRIPVLKELHGEKELQELAVASTVVSDRGERTEMISRTFLPRGTKKMMMAIMIMMTYLFSYFNNGFVDLVRRQ